MTEQMLTVAEIAAKFKLSKMTIYRLVNSGAIPALRVGRSLRIEEADLENYMRKVRTDGAR